MSNLRISFTRRNIIAWVVCTALACGVANRITGWIQTRGIESLTGEPVDVFIQMASSFATEPIFFDRSSAGVTFVVLVLFILYFILRFDFTGMDAKKREYYNKEYGGARWATKAEMERFSDRKNSFGNIILSQNASISLKKNRIPKFERNKHILVYGGSGSGKSFNFLRPNLLNMFSSYVVTDPKGELFEDTAKALIDGGYEVLVLNTDDPSCSMTFNPFSMVHTEVDILRLANCIVDNTQPPEGHKDFWVQSELLLYECCIGYMFKFAPVSKRNIDTLIRLVGMAQVEEENEHAVSSLDIVFRDIEERFDKDDDEYFLAELYQGFKKGAGKTLKSILVSCEVRLAPFKIPQVRRMMRTDEIGDLSRLAKTKHTKVALFVILSAGDSTYKFISAMFFHRLFDDLVRYAKTKPGKTLPQRVWVGLDEAGTVGKIPDFERHIAFLRSFGINIATVLQSEAQLDEVYGEHSAKIIKGNCDTTLFLGRCDHATNESFSKELGNETIIVESSSRSTTQGSTVSEQKKERPLMSADDLGNENFPADACIVKHKQAFPFMDSKYNTLEHPRSACLDAEKLDLEEYVASKRYESARAGIFERFARRNLAMPDQGYYRNVVKEVVLMAS